MTKRYVRAKHLDTRIRNGDHFASDAWIDTKTNEVKRVSVTFDPNRALELEQERRARALPQNGGSHGE